LLKVKKEEEGLKWKASRQEKRPRRKETKRRKNGVKEEISKVCRQDL
jgi:hypothetical protein